MKFAAYKRDGNLGSGLGPLPDVTAILGEDGRLHTVEADVRTLLERGGKQALLRHLNAYRRLIG